ncbi:MAG: hypothetical protein DHS80DRAFT_25331 [Piptocephalis tieghemiana]|nr:MAG: hypothetical protein DHS80DRAFT_25331 [Piptocephalis tieghemiana]
MRYFSLASSLVLLYISSSLAQPVKNKIDLSDRLSASHGRIQPARQTYAGDIGSDATKSMYPPLSEQVKATCGEPYRKLGKELSNAMYKTPLVVPIDKGSIKGEGVLIETVRREPVVVSRWVVRTMQCFNEITSKEVYRTKHVPPLEFLDAIIALTENTLLGYWPIESRLKSQSNMEQIDDFISKENFQLPPLDKFKMLEDISRIRKSLPVPVDSYMNLLKARMYQGALKEIERLQVYLEKNPNGHIGQEEASRYISKKLQTISKNTLDDDVFRPYRNKLSGALIDRTHRKIHILTNILEAELELSYATFGQIKANINHRLEFYKKSIPDSLIA